MEQIARYGLANHSSKGSLFLDYLVMLLLIANTGFHWCFNYNEMIYFWIFPIVLVLYLRRQPKFSIQFLFVILFYIIWCLFQAYFQSTSGALINFGIRLIIYYVAAISLRNIPKLIIRVMVWISIVSIVMYLLCLLPSARVVFRSLASNVHPIGSFTDETATSNPGQGLIFYFLSSDFGVDNFRNSGPFWEPGMFGVFINIALSLAVIHYRSFRWDCIILIIAGLSTFSTTTYLGLIIVLVYYMLFMPVNRKSIILIPIIVIGFVLFLQSYFGLDKILDDAHSNNTFSRFGAINYHLSLLKNYLFIGRGFASYGGTLLLSPNGLSLILLFWGLPMGIAYYYLLVRGGISLFIDSTKYNQISGACLVICILFVMAFSQDVTLRHFYFFISMCGLHKLRFSNTLIRWK